MDPHPLDKQQIQAENSVDTFLTIQGAQQACATQSRLLTLRLWMLKKSAEVQILSAQDALNTERPLSMRFIQDVLFHFYALSFAFGGDDSHCFLHTRRPMDRNRRRQHLVLGEG